MPPIEAHLDVQHEFAQHYTYCRMQGIFWDDWQIAIHIHFFCCSRLI